MSNLANERFRTSNRVNVYLRGDGARTLLGQGTIAGGKLGNIAGAGMSGSTGAHAQFVVGEEDPVDILGGNRNYTVRLATLTLVNESAITPIIDAQPVDIETVDRINNNPVAKAEGCVLADFSFDFTPGSVIAKNLNFIARRIV